MESARESLARVLPSLCYVGGTGTDSASVSHDRISAAFLHPWVTFDQDMAVALQSLNLSTDISFTDDTANERNITAYELGLTTRFFKHACDAVSKALSVSNLPNIRFGDIQCVHNDGPTLPDVTVYYFSNSDSPT